MGPKAQGEPLNRFLSNGLTRWPGLDRHNKHREVFFDLGMQTSWGKTS